MKIPDKISSISDLHSLFKLNKPDHHLISVIDFADLVIEPDTILGALYTDFYVIALKKGCAGRCKYGMQYYQEGIMYFIAPHQVLQFEDILLSEVTGSLLVIHPDFLQGYQLAALIRDYGYFSYSSNEALHLSDEEGKRIMEILENIRYETNANIDAFTKDLIIANIYLLLKYCDRFYNRQFLTGKKANSDLLRKLENLIDGYFKNDKLASDGIPTVQFIAQQLNYSPNYLSDLLRSYTGQTTQQHIQYRLIEKAKDLLSTSGLSVSEIAYRLGFEHPQSFHRLFKNHTSVSPTQFRQSFNM